MLQAKHSWASLDDGMTWRRDHERIGENQKGATIHIVAFVFASQDRLWLVTARRPCQAALLLLPFYRETCVNFILSASVSASWPLAARYHFQQSVCRAG